MSGRSQDRRLRDAERGYAQGDNEARLGLIAARVRAGLCPWCGSNKPCVHQFEVDTPNGGVRHFEQVCCCKGCFELYGLPNGGICGECPALKQAQAQANQEATGATGEPSS